MSVTVTGFVPLLLFNVIVPHRNASPGIAAWFEITRLVIDPLLRFAAAGPARIACTRRMHPIRTQPNSPPAFLTAFLPPPPLLGGAGGGGFGGCLFGCFLGGGLFGGNCRGV